MENVLRHKIQFLSGLVWKQKLDMILAGPLQLNFCCDYLGIDVWEGKHVLIVSGTTGKRCYKL